MLEEGKTTCCYAKSEKSWIADPDGVRIVLVEVPEDHPIRRDTRNPRDL